MSHFYLTLSNFKLNQFYEKNIDRKIDQKLDIH